MNKKHKNIQIVFIAEDSLKKSFRLKITFDEWFVSSFDVLFENLLLFMFLRNLDYSKINTAKILVFSPSELSLFAVSFSDFAKVNNFFLKKYFLC